VVLNAVEDLGHKPVWLRRENTSVSIEDGEVTVEPNVDVIANRLLLSNSEESAEGLGLAATFSRIRPMLNQPSAVLTAIHKFATATTLADWNIPVPDALLALSNEQLNEGRKRFGSVKGGKVRPVVDLVIRIGGRQHTVTASVEDCSHMDYPLLLGRDILQHYQVDVRRRADVDQVHASPDVETEEYNSGR
jgi:hypothetical protein